MLSMKKAAFTALVVITLLYFGAVGIAEAHPGRTDANGCHTCRTNCSSWGLSDGEYHCHGGGSSSGGSTGGSYTAPVQETVQTQEMVVIPTNTPVPLRLPTRIPTRVPTKRLTPTPTVAASPTVTLTPTIQPTRKAQPLKASVSPQKQQGFFDWLLGLLGLR
jgi:hypothetical protein